MAKVKTKYIRMKELRAELHWFQLQVRLDIQSLKRSKDAVKRVAETMRKVQRT